MHVIYAVCKNLNFSQLFTFCVGLSLHHHTPSSSCREKKMAKIIFIQKIPKFVDRHEIWQCEFNISRVSRPIFLPCFFRFYNIMFFSCHCLRALSIFERVTFSSHQRVVVVIMDESHRQALKSFAMRHLQNKKWLETCSLLPMRLWAADVFNDNRRTFT